eukprot:9413336-Heterocapsa_arctica.AAC.1
MNRWTLWVPTLTTASQCPRPLTRLRSMIRSPGPPAYRLSWSGLGPRPSTSGRLRGSSGPTGGALI